jgi:hypothetical protein
MSEVKSGHRMNYALSQESLRLLTQAKELLRQRPVLPQDSPGCISEADECLVGTSSRSLKTSDQYQQLNQVKDLNHLSAQETLVCYQKPRNSCDS